MVSPLLPVGGAALGTMAWQALREVRPGQFLRELLDRRDAPDASGVLESTPAKPHAMVGLDLAREVPSLAESLRNRLIAAGVDLSQAVVLKDDGHGGIIVDGDHRDRVTIEQIMSSDGQLKSDFLLVAAAATAQRDAAAGWIDGPRREFRLRLDDTTASVHFE